MSTKRKIATEMFPLLKAHLAEGGDRDSFCRSNQFTESSYYYGLSKYRKSLDPPAPSSFVALKVGKPAGSDLRMVLANGIELHFEGLPPVRYLAEFLEVCSA